MTAVLIKNIKDRVSESHIPVSVLERRAGLKPSALRNILHGRSKNPTIETVSQLANQLGCSVEDLLGLTPNKTTETLPLNLPLLKEAIQGIFEYIEEDKIKPCLDDFLSCIKEVYKYTIKQKSNTPDKCFIEWIGERTFEK